MEEKPVCTQQQTATETSGSEEKRIKCIYTSKKGDGDDDGGHFRLFDLRSRTEGAGSGSR